MSDNIQIPNYYRFCVDAMSSNVWVDETQTVEGVTVQDMKDFWGQLIIWTYLQTHSSVTP